MSNIPEGSDAVVEDTDKLTTVQQIVNNDEQKNESPAGIETNDLLVTGQLGNDITNTLKELFSVQLDDKKIDDNKILITGENIMEKTYIYSGNNNDLISTIIKVKDSGIYSKVAVYLGSENINNDNIVKFLNAEKVDILFTTNSLKRYITSIQG